jgi:hypothetical protein
MRPASRIFAAIGIFALVAGSLLVLGYGPGSAGARAEGGVVLLAFSLACWFLAALLRPQGARELDGLHLPGEDEPEHEGEIHLPGPSWYPVLYSVAGVLLVVGLVTRYEIAVAGGVLVVLASIGWGVESVREYRREIAHALPEPRIDPEVVAAAHRVQAFAHAHHGAEAVVQHVGNGKAEIAVVGHDGAWGSIAVRDVAAARAAVPLAGVTMHETWPAGTGARIAPDPDLWQRMAGHEAPRLPHGPRDGETQVGARIFLPIGVFAVVASLLFWIGNGDLDGSTVQGGFILAVFALTCWFLFVALRNARGSVDDLRYAGEDDVAPEPTEPEPPVDLATLHLPGPSIWPAAFSVAGTLVVLGLIFQLTLTVAGIGLLVLCAVGWGIESVREYRGSISGGHGHAASDH